MQYIILDLEWNQPWPGSPSSKKTLPVPIHGEIIQIGAVRMLEDQTIGDEFQILVRPHYYRRLNRRVSSLTGLKDARLKAEGVSFPQAIEQFRAWCGEDCVFLTWGFDDITLLRENLQLFRLDTQWVGRWFNAQMMFNAQTDGSTAQKALKTAMELLNIEPSRPAHDALGDAYHTALICARLDLQRGCREYDAALKSHENGFHGAQLPGCISRQVFHGYEDKAKALAAMEKTQCPACGQLMEMSRWYSQPGRRYMTMAQCPEHGSYLVRIRLSQDDGEAVRVSRLIYEGSSEAAQSYEKLAQTPKRRPRRRRRSRSKAKKPAAQTTQDT